MLFNRRQFQELFDNFARFVYISFEAHFVP